MFEATATEDLLREVRAYDFDADPVLDEGFDLLDRGWTQYENGLA